MPIRLTISLVFAAFYALPLHADVFRWDDGELIPGTEGIEPGPGATFDHLTLQFADLTERDLTGASFHHANLQGASFYRTNLTNANLSDAIVTHANFVNATSHGFTDEQLYSTASYKAKDLQGIDLTVNDLAGWDFNGQDLSAARLDSATVTGADFTDALIQGTDFTGTTSKGFTEAQLYSTASYQERNLQRIVFGAFTESPVFTWFNDLTMWDLSGQDLSYAAFVAVALDGADLSGANLSNAALSLTSLADANLTESVLWNAYFYSANLENTVLIGAQLQNAYLKDADLSTAVFGADTEYNQWTAFPPGFDPVDAGLTLKPSLAGDFNADDVLDLDDINDLAKVVRRPGSARIREMFDVNSDAVVDEYDIRYWVGELKRTWFGDANLDGEFNSEDLVAIFTSGEYEDDIGTIQDGPRVIGMPTVTSHRPTW